MASPFPGMDPYLEAPAFWPGVHTTLVVEMRREIARQLPSGYYAEIDQYVWVQEADPDRGPLVGKPDAFVAASSPVPAGTAAIAIAEPTARTALAAPKKKKGNRYIRIVDQTGNRVVTVIELLSPANKDPGGDRDNYIAKRNEYLATGTNLVEMDLLRAGDRVPLGKPSPPPADYYVLVSRAKDFPRADVWGFTVRDAIPGIPVPLNPGSGTIPLFLRPGLDLAYEDAGCERRIDYSHPPAPPLRKADAEWAEELLRQHAKLEK
jgi:hypothetical protein